MTSRSKGDRPIRILAAGRGYAATGPGYYVWDERREEVARSARALQGGSTDGHPASRPVLVLMPPEREP